MLKKKDRTLKNGRVAEATNVAINGHNGNPVAFVKINGGPIIGIQASPGNFGLIFC